MTPDPQLRLNDKTTKRKSTKTQNSLEIFEKSGVESGKPIAVS